MNETATTNSIKVYVPVLVAFDENGKALPREIAWEDGQIYKIDKITDIRQAAATTAGGQGHRYTVRICGKESYLFFKRSAKISGPVIGRWFVERRV